MTDIKVHNASQIGGCVTVITSEYEGEVHRILIDYGSSLPGSPSDNEYRHNWANEPVDAVLFTHNHGDHVGRLLEIPADIPIYMGKTARQVMINIQESLSELPTQESSLHKKWVSVLKDDERVKTFNWNGSYYDAVNEIPGFWIEPYSVDHSAYDAYMFLIETPDETRDGGRYVTLHTGDFRGHGRRGKKMLDVIYFFVRKRGKRRVDALVTEGTMMSRSKEKTLTEYQMQMKAARYLSTHKYAFLICSSTNMDSLAGFYNAAQMASYPYGRYMYVYSPYCLKQLDLFTKTAGEFSDVYRFDRSDVINFSKKFRKEEWSRPKTQLELMEYCGFITLIKPEDFCEKYIDEFVSAYNNGRIDEKPVIIWSMWNGYLDPDPKNKAKNEAWIDFIDRQKKKGIEIKYLHTSGHATPSMIAKVINAVDPQDKLIPMHTECPDEFLNLPIKDEIKERYTP